jgi:hypothetical protein
MSCRLCPVGSRDGPPQAPRFSALDPCTEATMSHIQMQRMLTVGSTVIHPVGNLWQMAVVCPPLKGVQGDV